MGREQQPRIIHLAERSTTKEVVIPSEMAHAVGNALKRLLDKPMSVITNNISVIEEQVPNPILNGTAVESMKSGVDGIAYLVRGFLTAKEVMIVPWETGEGNYCFQFSKETEDPKKPKLKPERMVMDGDLSRRFKAALAHGFNTPLTKIWGFSQLTKRDSKDEAEKGPAEIIIAKSRQLNSLIKPLVGTKCDLVVTTNNNLRTSITPNASALHVVREIVEPAATADVFITTETRLRPLQQVG